MQRGTRLLTIPGSPPDLAALPPGCAFAERCAWAQPECRQGEPAVVTIAPGHVARCLRTQETSSGRSPEAGTV